MNPASETVPERSSSGRSRRSLVTVMRSERYSAVALAVSATAGLLLANSVAGPGLIELSHLHIAIPGTRLDLTLGHWVTDGLLALFFFIVAVELRHELTKGELNSVSRAMAPAVAAVAGVIFPSAVYLLVAGGSDPRGWPIPVATDIAFALGLIALVGRGLPSRIRVFLLALAVIDDLIAIILIAVLFAKGFDPVSLVSAFGCVAIFWGISCLRPHRRAARILQTIALIVLGIGAWAATASSGVHATLAGVALGLALRPSLAHRAVDVLQPGVNAVVLPLFAFVSSLVVLPVNGLSGLTPVFFGIALALPLGKILGITLGGWLVSTFARRLGVSSGIRGWDLVTVAAVAGIGFTVSLLMNQLAFSGDSMAQDQGVLGVLAGSAISAFIAGSLVAWRARVARVRTKQRHE